MFSELRYLEKLDLSDNEFSYEQSVALFEGLTRSNTVKTLKEVYLQNSLEYNCGDIMVS